MQQTSASVAVVILNFNGKKYLETFLPSVLATAYSPIKIIVADNASTDDSVPFLQTSYPQVQVISIPRNLGYAGGYNYAMRHITATYAVLLNSDVEVTAQWLQPLVQLAEQQPNIAAIQPTILSQQHKNYFEYAGAAGGFIDALGYPFARGRIFDTLEQNHEQYTQNIPVFWASGAALFIRTAVFKEVGGFDESFFAHQEEIDLCWRLQLAGYQVWASGQSMVYHVGGGTLPVGKQKLLLNCRNNLKMLRKNLPVVQRSRVLAIRLLLDQVFAFKSLFTGKWPLFAAVWQAHWTFLTTSTQKHGYQPRPLKQLQGVYSGSVVWQYFVRNKKIFTKIVTQNSAI
jgi:GT2 family glycosyltransferase